MNALVGWWVFLVEALDLIKCNLHNLKLFLKTQENLKSFKQNPLEY